MGKVEGVAWVEVALYLLSCLSSLKPANGSNCWEMSRGQVWLLMDWVCLIGIGGMWFVWDSEGGGVAWETKTSVEIDFNG